MAQGGCDRTIYEKVGRAPHLVDCCFFLPSEPKGALSRLLEQHRSSDNEIDSLYNTVLDACGNWKEESFCLVRPLGAGHSSPCAATIIC